MFRNFEWVVRPQRLQENTVDAKMITKLIRA